MPTSELDIVPTQRARKVKADAEYRKAREQRLVSARGRCEFRVYAGVGHRVPCDRLAIDAHHVMRRSHQVDHDVENLRVLCKEHHQYIHANVEWAKENGWIKVDWPQLLPRSSSDS